MSRRTDEFSEAAKKQAKVLLGRGWPNVLVAEEVGVHRNTVGRWGRDLGYSVRSSNRHGSKRATACLRGFLRLSRDDQDVVLAAVASIRKRKG